MAKAILIGKVTRVAELNGPTRTEFTVDVTSTTMDGHEFTIGGLLTFEVNTFRPLSGTIGTALSNLAVTDEVHVEMEENENGVWKVTALANFPKRGRPAGSFLNDIKEELKRYRKEV